MPQRLLFVDLGRESQWSVELDSPEPFLSPSVPLLPVLLQTAGADVAILGRGPLAGFRGVGLATAHVTCVSPQSGGIVEAKVEGPLGAALEAAGVHAVVLLGRADHLVGLHVAAGGGKGSVTIHDAARVAGATVWQTSRFARRIAEGTTVCIGASGEARLPAASVVVDDGFPTTLGGVGAVLGRMNVKFLLLPRARGSSTEAIDDVTATYAQAMPDNPLTRSQLERPGFAVYAAPELGGYLAGGGFAAELPESLGQLDRGRFTELVSDDARDACPGCPQRCLKAFSDADGHEPPDGGRAHQLGIASFATQWGDPSPERAVRFNSYCHEAGVEHLYATALLVQEQPDRDAPVEDLVSSVLPATLTADGLQIKGMAIPPFDPRGSQGLGLAMALNPGGPRYDVVEHDVDFDPTWSWDRHTVFGAEFGMPARGLPLGTLGPERVPGLLGLWSLWSGLDALGVCLFASPPTRELRVAQVGAMARSVCSQPLAQDALLELGRLRLAVQRHTNALLGCHGERDTLPARFFSVPVSLAGRAGGTLVDRTDFERSRAALLEGLAWRPAGGVDTGSPLWARARSLLEAVGEQVLPALQAGSGGAGPGDAGPGDAGS